MPYWHEFPGTAKTHWYLTRTVQVTLFRLKQGKRAWPGVDNASLLCADWICFLVYILFQGNDYLKFFFSLLQSKVGREQKGTDGSVCLKEGERAGRCAHCGWCSSLCPCMLSTPWEWLSPLRGAGHHRTGLFCLKSAGFKALCWQELPSDIPVHQQNL